MQNFVIRLTICEPDYKIFYISNKIQKENDQYEFLTSKGCVDGTRNKEEEVTSMNSGFGGSKKVQLINVNKKLKKY